MNTPNPTPPLIVAVPNTSDLKMRALLELAQATQRIARALESTSVSITISGCTISSEKTGIEVGFADDVLPDAPENQHP